MHILFLTDNFPPEGNAPATRTYEHAIHWVKLGHQVTVITCAPNFPEGKLFEGYTNRWYSKTVLNGITIVRVKTYITANQGFFKRVLDYLSFMLTSFIAGLFQKKGDVVVATSPQFFTAVSGWLLSVVRRMPFIFELRDMWPASITAVGAMKSSWIIYFLEFLELFLYKRADRIVTVTHSFKQDLVARGVDDKKIDVVLNGVDLSRYSQQDVKDEFFVAAHNLENKFIVGYIGTHGLAHGLEYIVEAAELLQDISDICFLFVGGGAERQKLEKLVCDKGLTNVVMVPRQPKESMVKIWSVCDISLVNLRNLPLFSSVIPSKIFESMGMGIPVLLSIPAGEATEVVQNTSSGIVIPPEDAQQMADTIKRLFADRSLLSSYAVNASLSAPLYSRDIMAEKMISSFDKAIP